MEKLQSVDAGNIETTIDGGGACRERRRPADQVINIHERRFLFSTFDEMARI